MFRNCCKTRCQEHRLNFAFFCEKVQVGNNQEKTQSEKKPKIKNKKGWLVDWGLTPHQQLRSYGDGTSVYSPIRRTGEARDRTCDPWFTRRVT